MIFFCSSSEQSSEFASILKPISLSIRPSYGARGEEILDGGGGRGRRERFLSFTSLPFSLPFLPFSPETPDTQAKSRYSSVSICKQKAYFINSLDSLKCTLPLMALTGLNFVRSLSNLMGSWLRPFSDGKAANSPRWGPQMRTKTLLYTPTLGLTKINNNNNN